MRGERGSKQGKHAKRAAHTYEGGDHSGRALRALHSLKTRLSPLLYPALSKRLNNAQNTPCLLRSISIKERKDFLNATVYEESDIGIKIRDKNTLFIQVYCDYFIPVS